MSDLSDETLMAFADDRLDEIQRGRVEEELARSVPLRRRLAAFAMTRPDAELWRVFDEPMREPVPRHLVELLMSSGVPLGAGQGSQIRKRQGLSAVDKIKAFLLPGPAIWSPALAYSAAVAIGLSLGWVLHAANGTDATTIVADGGSYDGLRADTGMRSVLERTASGSSGTQGLAPAAAWQVVPTLTFRSRDGAYCRQYEMNQAGHGVAFAGVACRTAAGQWVVQAHVPAAKTAGVNDDKFRPATGASPVDATVARLIEGDPYGKDEERQLIGKGWRTDTK